MKIFTLSFTFLFYSILSVAQEFTVHEWGTFTSLYNSKGVQLNGMNKEEESLPNFVYNLIEPSDKRDCILEGGLDRTDFGYGYDTSAICDVSKGFSLNQKNVNVKMETPVLYFYSDNAIENIQVEVDFKGGSISQWYPEKEAGETVWEIEDVLGGYELDFSLPYVGNIQWNIDILHPQDKPDLLFDTTPNYNFNTWLAPRATAANIIKNDAGEVEKYLFYRGLANFDPKLTLSIHNNTNYLRIENKHQSKIDFVMVYDTRYSIDEPKVWFSSLNALETKSISLEKDAKLITSQKEAHHKLEEALVAAGLFQDEAQAMIKTWEHSYFNSNGCKVFWICPKKFVDELLPINIQPQPKQINRVFVGRSEIVTPEEEAEILRLSLSDFKTRYINHKFYYAYNELRNMQADVSTNISETSTVEEVTLYPNPTNGTLKLASQEVIQTIKIYDLHGKLVISQKDMNQNQISLPIDYLTAGAYVIEIQTANNLSTRKFLAQR